MTADDPPGPDVAAVLAAIVPAQRTADCDCECDDCPSGYEARHTAAERETWRDLDNATRTARQIRTEQR